MSIETVLPNKDQFDRIADNILSIATAVTASSSSSTWAQVQTLVRQGVGERRFPVGTQFTTSHTKYTSITWDVIAHNHYKNENGVYVPSMVLMNHSGLRVSTFDFPQAFYYAKKKLSAGTYSFTVPKNLVCEGTTVWTAGTYNFTLTQDLPAGGQLCIGASDHTMDINNYYTLTNLYVHTYNSGGSSGSAGYTEYVAISSGSAGTSLGTLGVELNTLERVVYGSGNYGESSMRQYLNSSGLSGSYYVPATKYSRSSSLVEENDGFMRGFDSTEGFTDVLASVKIPCVTNSVYESDDAVYPISTKYKVSDKFFLPSRKEIFGTSDTDDGSSQFEFFKEAAAVDRKKKVMSFGFGWWLRNPKVSSDSILSTVTDGGAYGESLSYDYSSIVPVCVVA